MNNPILATLPAFALTCLLTPVAGAHDSHTDDAMFRACDGKQLGTECSFENAHHDVFRGSCRSMSDTLVCVRNRPIEPAAIAPTTSNKPYIWALWLIAVTSLMASVVAYRVLFSTNRRKRSRGHITGTTSRLSSPSTVASNSTLSSGR